MKSFASFFRQSQGLWGPGLLSLLLAGCGSVQVGDPVNPARPFTFPGQAPSGTTPAVADAQPAPTGLFAQAQANPQAVPPAPGSVPPPTSINPAPPSGGNLSQATKTGPSTVSVLRAGDTVVVSFSDLPTPGLQNITSELGEDGKLTLHHNVIVQALGKTPRQLERDIRGEYVPKYYKYLTVTVRPEMRFIFVNGEVKVPAQYPWRGETSVLRVIGQAGGFTDWANRKKVLLTRATTGQKFTVNCVAAQKDPVPSKDLPVYPGDYINVPKKSVWSL